MLGAIYDKDIREISIPYKLMYLFIIQNIQQSITKLLTTNFILI